MIKKLIGILVAVAVVVVIVISAIRRDGFQSMLLRDGIMNQTFPTSEVPAEYLQGGTPAPGTVVVTDSVSISVTDTVGVK